jgi:hypothetical protein
MSKLFRVSFERNKFFEASLGLSCLTVVIGVEYELDGVVHIGELLSRAKLSFFRLETRKSE